MQIKLNNKNIAATSRELVLQAVNHQEPQRIPFTLYVAKPLYNKLVNMWGPREQWPCPADDTIRILWPVEVVDISPEIFKDRFGGQWQREHGGYTFINPLLKEPDASQIPRIEIVPQSDIELIIETRKLNPGRFIYYQFSGTFGERLWCLRGLEQTLMDYLLEPGFVHKALDILMEMHMEALDKILPLPIDGVTFGDDFGSQRGLMISRRIFLDFFKPRLAKMYEKVRLACKIVMHHTCGDNTEIMADLIDIGLQVFHPLQPEAMDICYSKREFGKYLTFRGGIGTQGDIVFGTSRQAREEVSRAVKVLSKGGGYLMETAKPLPEETPIENVNAVIDEMTRVMHYQFMD
jgi:uroporphyrinogen decarboxylase